MINNKQVIALLVASLLVGCSMAPKYERPDAPIESNYPIEASGQVKASDIGWQTFFKEPRLQALIALAIENNRDLRIAALRIEEARALYDIQWSERVPNVGIDGSGTRARTPNGTGGATYQGNYQVGLGVTAFELDFFGRVKSLSDAALAEYLATEQAQQTAYLSLVSEVAKTYLTERALAKQIELAQKSYDSYRDTYNLMSQRYAVGATSALELRQYETLMHSARVTVSSLQRQHAQTENALVVLIGGRNMPNLPPPAELTEDNILMEIAPGLPSELLTNRPDIKQQEQLLMAANANIGAARAAFFPRITLTGFAGTASTSLSGLFEAGSGAWTFMPQLTLPIFDAGRNMANLDLAHARKNIAVAQYEKSIQVAFKEVADALVARKWLNEQVTAQKGVFDSETQRLRLSQARYQNGIASSLDVLDAQRQLFAAEQALIDARLLRMVNAVELYRALGGGLTAPTTTNTP